ncbi:MAG: hypothetical protein RMY64_01065 [Nostoc sp. DedQUE08]|uniref:hypothetical protein n=1 Tax=unclassified Nostoc TaxID=2593658 RepID=UPI002AD32B7D|nr:MULTISPECIES: hypothetical protein [unclassified Nostoc]MDZ8064219.1 hypothetical protein [Nostoc sp. DedQUE08]MDZ8090906.1 hypothetical protein [Nostoc sp. DedQUE05]
MIISDLNYLENTTEEIIGGTKTITIIIKKPAPKPPAKFNSVAQADADAKATGGLNNVAVTFTNATVTPNSATASSSSYASTSN